MSTVRLREQSKHTTIIMAANQDATAEPWFLRASFPVFVPPHPALTLSTDDFDSFLYHDLRADDDLMSGASPPAPDDGDENFTLISRPVSTTADVREAIRRLDFQGAAPSDPAPASRGGSEHPFMQGLLSHDNQKPPTPENKMMTENGDVAHRSTTDPLVDLFAELEDVVSGPRLLELLNAAWARDSLVTLKLIFNARSIHLGKASRPTFYRCAGWLAQSHPLTLVKNLQWLSRPVIRKKLEAQDESGREGPVMVEARDLDDDAAAAHSDVRHGVAHGYWKDLLNILVLGVNNKLHPLQDPRVVLNVDERENKDVARVNKEEAKSKRHEARRDRNAAATAAFNDNPTYRALHLAVARLFAAQLQTDLVHLRGTDVKAKRDISLCAKWAPSTRLFHDKHTFIVSSIAEIMHPASLFPTSDRETYLRYARESYRKDVASLRAHLGVVERELTAKTYSNIKYDRVPSTAMNRYAKLFAAHDPERFEQYIDRVADGKTRISGATLLPSTLVHAVRRGPNLTTSWSRKNASSKQMIDAKLRKVDLDVADAQWKTLVQRIKDNGKLGDCIAVCDVSGSMLSPTFPDGTCPMDSAIGLSLLIAEVTQPPFGGAFITFSSYPKVCGVDLSLSFSEKIRRLQGSNWGMNTDLVAVFQTLILPMALKNKIKPEDMVKRVFVFSDMQFDSAGSQAWATSYERIAKEYAAAGYELPELVFWNLAGGRAGHGHGTTGDPTAPKPVTTDDLGTALVSGYSQGMLRVFLEGGGFEYDEAEADEDAIEVQHGGDDREAEDLTVVAAKKRKIDPLAVVKRAIRHDAYDMLRVVD